MLAFVWATALAGASVLRAEILEPWRPSSVPELTLPSLDDAHVDLDAQAGSLVIVHFFATWCEPCRDELASLTRLAVAFATRPLRIVAVDVGEPADRVRRFLERSGIGIPYPVLVDFDKRTMRAWGVEILPSSYVLDAGLCPLWKVAGALEWDSAPTRKILESEVAELEGSIARSNPKSCTIRGGVP